MCRLRPVDNQKGRRKVALTQEERTSRATREVLISKTTSGVRQSSCNSSCTPKFGACSKEACCTGDQTTAVQRRPSGINIVDDLNVVDIEKGAPVHEHVILSVQGLTCVGCENKLFRSLDSIPAVCNLKTSLVLSQAEFDLDLCGSSVDDVIRSVERMTGFGCQRLSSKGQDIDVVVGDGAGDFITLTYQKAFLIWSSWTNNQSASPTTLRS